MTPEVRAVPGAAKGPPDERSLTRTRTVLAVTALVVPASLFLLFERQARRLDALAEQGRPVQATVTALSSHGSTTHYAYRVDGTQYRWNVAHDEAPHAPGELFTATYLPADPSLSRPIAEPRLAAEEAARNRSFSWKVVLGVCLVLALFTFAVHHELGRLRSGGPSELSGPAAYKRRLAFAGLALLPLIVLVTGYHVADSVERGESISPAVLGLALTLAILGGVGFFVTRKGPEEAQRRAARLMRWLLPIALVLAVLQLIAVVVGY